MAKLLCERPRVGGGWAGQRRDRKTNPGEDSLRHESMGRKWVGRPKALNENLAPLSRFLRSCVGRKWDDVYSELREHVRVDSAIQLHILEHLWQFVIRDVVLIQGVPCHTTNEPWGHRFGLPIVDLHRRGGVLFVHPVSGLLSEVRPKRGKPRKRRNPRHRPAEAGPRRLSDGRQLHCLEGVWHAVVLAPFHEGTPPEQDAVLGPLPRPMWQHRDRLLSVYHRGDVYGLRADRLGPKELRKLGLE